jgi:hypothetical protein
MIGGVVTGADAIGGGTTTLGWMSVGRPGVLDGWPGTVVMLTLEPALFTSGAVFDVACPLQAATVTSTKQQATSTRPVLMYQ